jgi:hypothetical protein
MDVSVLRGTHSLVVLGDGEVIGPKLHLGCPSTRSFPIIVVMSLVVN